MKTIFPPTRPRQRGAAAVELALVLPILIVLLTVPLFLGRLMWHYTALQKAAFDAARYLSTVSAQEMRDPDLTAAVLAVANDIVRSEIAELGGGAGEQPSVDIRCDEASCWGVGSQPLPATVSVLIRMRVYDHMFSIDIGRYGVPLKAYAEVSYAGTD